jgi:signal transduction histidine kinase
VRRQFVLVVVAVTAMVVLAFSIPLGRLIDDFAQDRAITTAQQEAEALARSLTVVDASNPAIVEALISVGDPDVTRSVVLDSGDTFGPPVGSPAALETARAGSSVLVAEFDGVAFYVPVLSAGTPAVVRTFVGAEVLDRNVATAWMILAALGVVMIGLAAFVADRLARSIVEPVDTLAEAAERLGDGDLDVHVTPTGPPELKTVAGAFNRLGDRLAGLLRSERESVADLSHRLRTPLTALQLESEQLGEGEQPDRVRDAVDAMQREVDHLIREARRPIRSAAGAVTNLAEIVADRIAFWEPLANDQGRSVAVAIPGEPVRVAGARADIEAVVDALIGNVIAHTDEGVGFGVEVSAGPPVTLAVSDEGPGFADPDVVRRGVSAGGSTGLGLDIVGRTAEASGGQMTLGPHREGGARVMVEFGSVDD